MTSQTNQEPISCRPRELFDLPTELLVEVLFYLEWDDVLRTRQVCKRLQATSYERTVWLRLFTRYSDAMEPQLFRLEKPLQIHSSRELEIIIYRWKTLDQRWSRNDVAPALERKFVIERKSRRCSHLVRGGRWFLAGTSRGELKYVDLEAADLTPRILVPSPFIDNTYSSKPMDVEMRISVDLNYESPFLEFNLAIILGRYDEDPAEPRQVQIWKVGVDCDASGRVDGLAAQKLSSFSEEGYCNPRHISLFKDHVAYVIEHVHPKRPFKNTVVVNWVEADGRGIEYPRRVVKDPSIDWLYLIPGDMMLCGLTMYRLCYLKDIPISSSIPSLLVDPSARAVASLRLFSISISGPFFVQDSVRFLCSSSRGISGLSVRHDASPTMEIIPMYKGMVSVGGGQLGYAHGVSLRSKHVAFFGMCWPDEDRNLYVSPKLYPAQSGDPVSFVDELSGRVILTDVHGDEHTLLCT